MGAVPGHLVADKIRLNKTRSRAVAGWLAGWEQSISCSGPASSSGASRGTDQV